MSETNTNPFEDHPKDQSTMPDISVSTFEEPSKDISSPDLEEQNTTADACDTDPEEQEKLPSTTNNPFEDQSTTSNDSLNEQMAAPFGDEDRDRYAVDADDDSVRSMLEMMDAKNDPEVRRKNTPSLRTKARRSLHKWRFKSPPSLLGGMSSDGDDDDDDDQKTLESYDCIALSSLMRRKVEEDDDDEESMFSKPKYIFGDNDDEDAKSHGTSTTKNTGQASEMDAPISSLQRKRSRRLKYMLPPACFLAIVLLLGILVLSYSLYALRQDEDEELSVFTKEFWTEQIPKTLAFWKKDEGEE